MHTRRVATFLLGGWLGCSIFMMLVALENIHSSDLVVLSPVGPVAGMIKTLGEDKVTQLLQHHAAQETRSLYYTWEQAQILLAVVLGSFLYFATQKRMLSVALCGVMLCLVLFQYLAITPELAYRGREADFPQAAGSSGVMVRTLLLYQLMVASEGVKMVVGCVLASYLFAFRTSRRRSSSRSEIDTIDYADHSHIDG
jgi:membrane protein YdbS with pleckstrin-like domain